MSNRHTLNCPSIDNRLLYDAMAGRFAFPTLAVSVEIGLYEHLAKAARTIPEIASDLQLSDRAAEAVVSVVTAMGFLEVGVDGRFGPTAVAQTYAEMCGDIEVMRYIGDGQPLLRPMAWRKLAMMVGHWQSG